MSARVPGVSRVEAKPTEDGRLVLRFQDHAFRDPFIARFVSDGTIKMFAYLILLLNGAGLDEVYWLAKEDGFTKVRRASTDQLLQGLVDEGDKLGTLWRQGLFEGADPR